VIRERDIEHFRIALDGTTIPKDLAPHLPGLLWLYQMSLILFWIYDRSHDQRRTRRLRKKSLSLVVTAIRISTFPLMMPLRKRITGLIEAIEGD